MILIDGYNLMHAAGLMKMRFGPGGLERARRALLGILAGALRDDTAEITVVFDAQTEISRERSEAEPSPRHGIRLEFASGEGGADARIEQLIRVHSSPKRLTVVSSDARIRAAARRRGARPVDSESFWEQLLQGRRSARSQPAGSEFEKPAGRAAREFWLREFEGLISDADLRDLAGPFREDET